MPSALADLSRHLAARPADTIRVLGMAMARGMGRGLVAAVAHRSGEGTFTHLYLLPEAAVRGRAEVRLLAVLAGERLSEAAARARALPGFEPAAPLDAAAPLAA